MEKAMRLSLTIIAALAIAGGAVSAEPAKNVPADGAKPSNAESRSATIVLASADAVRPTVESSQPMPAGMKRRVAPRVTTCRCGDPQTQPDPQDQ